MSRNIRNQIDRYVETLEHANDADRLRAQRRYLGLIETIPNNAIVVDPLTGKKVSDQDITEYLDDTFDDDTSDIAFEVSARINALKF